MSKKGNRIDSSDLKHVATYLKLSNRMLVMNGLGELNEGKICPLPFRLVFSLVGHVVHSTGRCVDTHLK